MSKANDVAILDIGSKKVIVLIGEKTAKGIFNIKGVGSCGYSGFVGGEWFNVSDLKTAVAKSVNMAEADAGTKIKKLYIGVPSEFSALVCKEVILSRARASRIGDDDISALYEQGDTYANHAKYSTINYSAIYYTLDDSTRRYVEPRGLSAYKLTGLLSYILCERSFTALFEEIAHELKFKEIEYISAIWAETMSLFDETTRNKPTLLADIGYITSSIAVVRGDGLLHLASFSLGGGHIESDIAMMFEVPFKIAQEVKSKIDISLNYAEDAFYEAGEGGKYHLCANDINEVTKARLDTIVGFIQEGILQSGVDCPPYTTVYLTGGGVTQVRGAKEYMAAKLGKQIEIVFPSVPMFNKPQFSSSIGLLDIASKLNANGQSAFTNILKKLISKLGG
ncbi:MAG: cell division FtsA domain-containing protein [Clostridia bacterium]